MPTSPFSDAECIQAAQLRSQYGTNKEAADSIGKQWNWLDRRVKEAVKRGLAGPVFGSGIKVMDGFEVTRVNVGPRGTTVEQRPRRGAPVELLKGHQIREQSILSDAEGREVLKWSKTKEAERSPEETAQIIRVAFENFTPAAPYILPPKDNDDERLTAYILCDWHVGLFAYGKETGGSDWDLSIARKMLSEAMREIVETSPPSANALILGLGDLLHADNSRNQTERSGNVLDVDTRYSKCLETVCDLLVETSELIAAKHRHVEATFKPGNHDENSTSGIRQALRMYWRNQDRMKVDTSPDPFYWRRFGVNLIGGTHGDKAKIPDLPLIMANRRKEDWAASSTRHMHSGHIHHDTEREIGGVKVYSHRAPVAQDAYHAAHGYLAGRSVKSFTYHAEKGSRGHSEVEI
ncbi:hypothetical protein [Rhizobium rhizogenes]|uniref:hypothetical protein n=1 Tax=Rhizobium rhizogenes TaxID=359 RepID=UPI00226F0159|nr:hypothetical protein [Rhizobium rhizogenes]